MTDTQLERRLADRLHGASPPAVVPGLARRTQQLGTRLRRRRRWSAVGVAVAAAVAVPGVVWGTTGVSDSRTVRPAGTPTVAVPSSTRPAPSPTVRPAGPAPAGPFDPARLTAGSAAQLDYTVGDRWHHADGSVTTVAALTAGVGGKGSNLAVRSGSTLFVVHPSDRDGVGDSYSIGDGPVKLIPGGSTQSVGVQPGPSAGVLVETEEGTLVLDGDGRWSAVDKRFGAKGLYAGVVATRADAWAVAEGHGKTSRPEVVHFRSGRGPSGSSPFTYPQWTGIVFADPVSDRLVTVDDQDCNDLVDGTTGKSVWHSCTWMLTAVSADGGRVIAGRGDELAVLDAATGAVAFFIGTPVEGAMVKPVGFGRDGRAVLDVVVEADDGTTTQALVTCDAADCTRATPWVKGQQYHVLG